MSLIESLPLFPLSDVVLLPELSVPLHIFEARYRQMTRDALAGSQQIGMVTIRPDSLHEIAGVPAIFEIGCVGRIARAEKQQDGTFQILLTGTSRFRILEEDSRSDKRLFRSARVELLSDELPFDLDGNTQLKARRDQLLALLDRLVQRSGNHASQAQAFSALERLTSTHLVNALTQSITLQPIERQQLLEANSIDHRFEIMCDLLCFRLAEINGGNLGSSQLPN